MANICTTINNIEVSSYGELEPREVWLAIEAQPQKGDAHSPTNVVASSSTTKFGTTRNIHELGQVQVEQLVALW
jgi:hypothetical protein